MQKKPHVRYCATGYRLPATGYLLCTCPPQLWTSELPEHHHPLFVPYARQYLPAF